MNKNNPKTYRANKYKNAYGEVDTQSSYKSTIEPIINFLKTKQDGIFLELGVLGGSTLLGIHDTCKSRGIKIYGVDPWEKLMNSNGVPIEQIGETVWANKMIARKTMREHLQNIISTHSLNIKLFHDLSEAIVNYFDDESIDCIHVDANHSYEGVMNDMKLFWPKLKSSGMMLMDDYCLRSFPEVVQATNDFIKENSKTIDSHQKHMNKMKLFKKLKKSL